MNHDKARDYFSSYYEGSLEGGLKQSFEHRLANDAQLQAEYRAFQRTMEQLDQLKFEEIEVPFYLSDRIATRLEAERATKQRRSPLSLWLPRFAIGAVAAAAIIGAVVSVFSSGNPGTSVSGLPPYPYSNSLTVTTKGSQVTIHYNSATPHSVQICDSAGKVLQNFSLDAKQRLDTPLNNSNETPYLFEVKIPDNGTDELVAVPGTKRPTSRKGTGSLSEFAKALSGWYQTPVVLNVSNTAPTVTWNFDNPDEKAAAEASLDGTEYKVTQTESGVYSISG